MNNKTVNFLRSQGYCVVVFTPEELKQTSPTKVEDRLVETGWDIIHSFSIEEDYP